MNKALLLGAFLGLTLLANAQFSIGPVVGAGVQGPNFFSPSDNSTYVFTNSNGMVVNEGPYTLDRNCTAKPTFSYNVGVQAKIDFGKYFALSPSLTYQSMGAKMEMSGSGRGYSYSTKITGTYNYLAIPILIQGQYPINNQVTIGLGVGPTFNILIDGKEKIESSLDVFDSTFNTSVNRKVKAKNTVNADDEKVNADSDKSNGRSYYKSLNITLNIAPFVQFTFSSIKLLISPTYYLGLSNIASPIKYSTSSTSLDGYTTTHNIDIKDVIKTGGFGLNVSLLFGGSK